MSEIVVYFLPRSGSNRKKWLARVRHKCGQLGFPARLALLIFVLAMQPASAQASTLTILSPAAGDEIRGDGADLKNAVRFSTLQPSEFGYYVDISEVDQDAPTHPAIGLPVSIAVLATAVIPEGNHTFSFPFDFNRPELAEMGSGLFKMTLRSVTAATVTSSAPVLYFKGRPVPSLELNADDPFLLKCSASAGDPDASPDYEYRIQFVRSRDREEVATVNRTTSSAGLTQADLELPALEGWEDYDVTLSVADSLNRTGAAGQGLTGQTTIHVHANAGPIVSLSGLSDGAVFQAQTLPYVVTFGAMAIDDAPGSITLQADADGDGIPEAEVKVNNYGSATLRLPINTPEIVTVRVRAIDDKGQVGGYTVKTIRVNMPPSISIDPKLTKLGGGDYLPVILTAYDSFSDRLTVELSLNSDGTPEASQVVENGVQTTILLPVSGKGPFTLLARAVDGNGAASAYTKSMIQENTPPTITVLSPVDGSVLSRSFDLVVLVHDDYSAQAQIVADTDNDGIGDSFKQIPCDVPSSVTVSLPSPGTRSLSIWALDSLGINGLESEHVRRTVVTNDVPRFTISDKTLFTFDSLVPPSTIKLSRGLFDDIGQPYTAHWDFLDGTTTDTVSALNEHGVSATHTFQSLGRRRVIVKATDFFGESTDALNYEIQLNDRPQVFLQSIQPSVYDPLINKYLIQKGQETNFGFRANNVEHDRNALRIKSSFEPAGPGEYILDNPPADGNQAHTKDVVMKHTYYETGSRSVRFDVGEKYINDYSTGTLTLNVLVVETLPNHNAVKTWNRYR